MSGVNWHSGDISCSRLSSEKVEDTGTVVLLKGAAAGQVSQEFDQTVIKQAKAKLSVEKLIPEVFGQPVVSFADQSEWAAEIGKGGGEGEGKELLDSLGEVGVGRELSEHSHGTLTVSEVVDLGLAGHVFNEVEDGIEVVLLNVIVAKDRQLQLVVPLIVVKYCYSLKVLRVIPVHLIVSSVSISATVDVSARVGEPDIKSSVGKDKAGTLIGQVQQPSVTGTFKAVLKDNYGLVLDISVVLAVRDSVNLELPAIGSNGGVVLSGVPPMVNESELKEFGQGLRQGIVRPSLDIKFCNRSSFMFIIEPQLL